jgi:hypothetical protein
LTTNARKALTSILFIMGSGLLWLSGFMLHDSLNQFAGEILPTAEFLVPGILFVAGLIPVVIIIRDLVPLLTDNPDKRTTVILRILFLIGFALVMVSSFLYKGQ